MDSTDNDSATSESDSVASTELPGMRQHDYDMEFVSTPTETRDYDDDFDLIISSSLVRDINFSDHRDPAGSDFREDNGTMLKTSARDP